MRKNLRKKIGGRKGKPSRRGSRFWETPINNNPIRTSKIRYTATTAFNGYITARCLLNSVLAFQNVASAEGILVMDAVRLRSVKVAYLSTTGFGTSSAEIGLTSYGEKAPERRLTSRGTSFMPANIKFKPLPGTYADMWYNLQDNIEAILFNLDCPADSILDITYEWTMAEGSDTNLIAVTNPTASGIFYAALDNSTVSPALSTLYLRPDYLSYIVITGVTSSNDKRLERKQILDQLVDDIIIDKQADNKIKILQLDRKLDAICERMVARNNSVCPNIPVTKEQMVSSYH